METSSEMNSWKTGDRKKGYKCGKLKEKLKEKFKIPTVKVESMETDEGIDSEKEDRNCIT